ncbi:rhomboid family intramembrane serine protease [Pseudomaricurvus alkylphenolicus]|uniref:rhomboid family intramembrane serine protease n=1 Tax=Pseudomaricurvus alkylphenolicus TaxID=1306991 RepID=UPI0014241C7C|nr:rhomboid family intramembrane serine protease [Pseudomaricurvus alkylphenolicus]NIB41131.1 rhomboid family intramembrane serine protease [Pseudomaricurvus alkylphenolicus]
MKDVNWHRVHGFALDLNLTPLLRLLQSRGVVYRVTEERGQQCLWVADSQVAGQVRDFVHSEQFAQLNLTRGERDSGSLEASGDFLLIRLIRFAGLLQRLPVTVVLILLGCAGALLMEFDRQLQWVGLLTFQPIQVVMGSVTAASLGYGLQEGQWWRLLTPVFLHFGLFHILFNSLWIWEFGRRIELVFGSPRLVWYFLFIGVLSNLVQYIWQGPSLFGGLSGVVYGLLGFLWIYHRRNPHPGLFVQPGIIGFMLLWMAMGMFGVVDVFIAGSVANAAHFGGLVAGMLLGALVPTGVAHNSLENHHEH